jgi:glycosyl-4,4'-diaponeurosporenoate acyltransferase
LQRRVAVVPHRKEQLNDRTSDTSPRYPVPRFTILDSWFRPRGFESERLYERMGALVIKRYVPTGGDLIMRRIRRDHPERRWVTANPQSLCRYERRTRLNESIHLIGFVGFIGLTLDKFVTGSLTALGLAVALALNLMLGLWPIVLQRYNRLRLYRAIQRYSRLSHRS